MSGRRANSCRRNSLDLAPAPYMFGRGVGPQYDTAFPPMTSNTAPAGYVASASQTNYSQPYVCFAQDGAASFWGMTTDVGWLKIQFPSLRKATNYSLQNRSGAANQHPTAWQLQGSLDGSSWTTIDAQSGQTAWGDAEIKTYSISSPRGWLYYRLNITDNALNPNIAVLSEWSFTFSET